MNVLSLFGGIECGKVALHRAGIHIDKYYSSEIDKYAIKVAMDNHPDTIQLGSVVDVHGHLMPEIDLLIGGSPCQGFSFAGKGLNFDDPRSKLFFEYVRVLNELREHNPDVLFLLENVGMLQQHKDVISHYLGVKPKFINSRQFSAQDRKRWYWTNIYIDQIDSKLGENIGWDTICEDGWFAGAMRGRRINPLANSRSDYDLSIPIKQYIECRKDNKTNCLTTVGKDTIAVRVKTNRQVLDKNEYRYLTRNEIERLQTLPDNYTKSVSLSKAGKLVGNGWTVDAIAHIFKNIK